ncbi:rod shape-determining protein MreC [Paenibacillus herberti]|uniref:Cell shape-determining protein MreC n=1 Tax=Paenibacillus herberti TaxID=1619309 RepID=A0A229P0C6_9BACL|nr:rod shape-determining protein MreC [Paenibacillus herberti]OXM15355.1 rod shape-determining protein MreC [Paenibacillus herberti]
MISFILFIAVIGYSISSRAGLTVPEKFLRDTTAYVQQWFYKPAGYIAGLFQDIGNLRSVYEENEQLRMTAAAYAREKVEYNLIQQQNERLQAKLNFTEEQKKMYDYKYLIAQVVAVSPDAFNRTMTINLGTREGLRERMAVTTEDGMIGFVSEVSELTSTVMPITSLNDEESGISVTVLGKQNQSFGILSGYNSETEHMLMTKIAANDPIKKHDIVITSGLGNIYPRGMVIGKVDSIQDSDIGLTRTANIKLSANFDHLNEVFVVQTPGASQ